MAGLYAEFEAFLAREGVTKADFCSVTGFPTTTLNSIRLAAAPRQSTVDRLMLALAAWSQRTSMPPRAAKTVRPKNPAKGVKIAFEPYASVWAKDAALSSDIYLAAVARANGTFAAPITNPIVEDLAQPRPALSRDPCRRCGVRGDLGCAHQLPMQEAWQ